jgi:hypothetical protein
MAIDAHLQMIQAVITRLAAHCTTIKGWSVTVSGALLGYATSASTPVVAVIAAYVIVAFAVLDAYYLALERQYRILYREAVEEEGIPWLMDVVPPSRRQVLAALGSPVNVILYGSSVMVAAAVSTYLLIR